MDQCGFISRLETILLQGQNKYIPIFFVLKNEFDYVLTHFLEPDIFYTLYSAYIIKEKMFY